MKNSKALSIDVRKLQASGLIFGGEYTKKDGTITKFNGRGGVHKFVKGGINCNNPHNLLIWDTNRERYMAIVPENLVSINFQGEVYEQFSY